MAPVNRFDGWQGLDQLSRPCERNRSFFAARTVSARKKLSSICGQSRSKASGSTPGWELKRLRANSFQYATISSTKAVRSAVSGVLAGFCLSSIAVSPPQDTALPPAVLLHIAQVQSKPVPRACTHVGSRTGAYAYTAIFA